MKKAFDPKTNKRVDLHLDRKAAATMLNIGRWPALPLSVTRSRRKSPLRSPRNDESKQESDGHGMDGRLTRHLSQLSPEN
jgi:hypothetical protein